MQYNSPNYQQLGMMNLPLKVVQDDQGRFRDINNQPMIMILNNKARHPRTSGRLNRAKEKSRMAGPKPFEFINITKPDNGSEDEEVRTLIRTHVMRSLNRRERRKCSSSLHTSPGCIFPPQDILLPMIPPQPPAYGPTFIPFPVQMQPYMRRLIHQCATNPRQHATPADSAWFPMAMSDPALFHAILCTSAIYIGLISGQQDLYPQHRHMLEAISLINTRLRQINTSECVSDSTITTVLFLAKAEARFVTQDTELIGCIETGFVPRFTFVDGPTTIGPSISLTSLTPGIQSLTKNHLLDRSLFALLMGLENYSRNFEDKTALTVDLESTAVYLRYQLLSWTDHNSSTDQRSVVQQVIRIGAIVHLDSLLGQPSIRGIDYTVMLSRLRAYLLRFQTTCVATRDLLLWLLFMGGSTSGNPCRAWFIAKMLDVTTQAGINVWDDAKLLLMRFWWVESLYEGPWQQFWEEVRAIKINVLKT
ncbi:hypothetical protein BP5796_02043 [Coleophoma crateriformis]|uniref:Transcription factor domain-containing protein n=1 Tax=Coleophoma crateriformis TaxID=565419 RepID=A0A3D8T2B8_9HELO|nr:hypothetical protein BP5796_02043 [Coleophoma crateriformis]